MTKEKALKLLNLIEPFTEDDLNKAFRSLTNKWHPDKFLPDTPEYIQAQEKMTELNIARDALKKILKERNNNYSAYQTSINNKNINDYKTLLTVKLAKYISDKSMNVKLKKYYDNITALIASFIIETQNIYQFAEINAIYMQYDKKIINVLDKLKREIFSQSGIDENIVTETINYDCTIVEFYNQIIKLREKYQKIMLREKYQKKIIEDLRDYELRAGYDYLKHFFPDTIKYILAKLERNNFRNYDDVLKIGKRELDEVFDMYFNILSQFKEINNFLSVQSLDDPTILKISLKYKEVLDGFNNHVEICDTEESLEKILFMIDEYKKKKESQEKLSAISDYIKIIVAKYNNAIHKFTYPDELSKAEIATGTLNRVFEIIKLMEKGLISVEEFKQLVNLKFDSYDEDSRVLNLISGYSNSKYIFIRNEISNNLDDILLGRIISEDDEFVTIEGNAYRGIWVEFIETKLRKSVFYTNYIPLEVFLKSATFCGFKYDIPTINKIILYAKDLCAIVYDLGRHSIDVMSFYDTIKESKNIESKSIPFKNIYYTINFIDEYFNELKAKKDANAKKKRYGKIH